MEEEQRPPGFRRRRPPSPQATRLMLFALLSSIGLAVTLTYVFLPTLLFWESQPKEPHYRFSVATEGSTSIVTIVEASNPWEADRLGYLLVVDNTTFKTGPLTTSGDVIFFDDGDGLVGVGDYFEIQIEAGHTYAFLIVPLEQTNEGGFGYIKWTP